MTYEFLQSIPVEIFGMSQAPCVSVYLPTHRQLPQRRQDEILFGNLLQDVENRLKEDYPKYNGSIMKRLKDIQGDHDLWSMGAQGMVVFANDERSWVYLLEMGMEAIVGVGKGFMILPLLRYLQNLHPYQVLAISGKEWAVYEGNRFGLKEVSFGPDTPRTMDEILGSDHTEKYTTHGIYGADGGTFFHGQGSKKDDHEMDLERFYRFIDHYVHEHISKLSQLPLVFAGLSENHNLFHRVSDNGFLWPDSVDYSLDTHDLEELSRRTWSLIEPHYLKQTKTLLERFGELHVKDLGSEQIKEIVLAAVENRVETLLIEENRNIPGEMVDEMGTLRFGGNENLLDDLASMVLHNHGQVVVLPAEKMPNDRGLAAIYRF